MGTKIVKKFKALPFEEGKTYTTRFATKEKFTVNVIRRDKNGKMLCFEGVYEKSPHLGNCQLNLDRLIPEMIEDGTEEVCDHCNRPIK